MPLSWCWFQWTRQRRTPSRSLRTAVFRISRKPASGDARMHHWITVIRIAGFLIEFLLKLRVLWMFIMRALCHGILFTIVVWHDVLQWERMRAKKYRQRMGRKSREKKKRRRTQQHRFCTDLLNSTMAWVGPFWKHTMFSRWYCY